MAQAQKPTWPKSRPKPQPTVDDSYKCIVPGGHRIEIKKSIVPQIPYFKEFISPTPGSYASVLKMNSRGEYLLPKEIDVDYLMPILAFVETGRFSDLMTKLPMECDILEMAALFERLGINKPVFGDVDTMSTDSLEDASKFCIGILLELIEKNQTNYFIHNRLWQEIEVDQVKPEVFRHHASVIISNRKMISKEKRKAKRRAKVQQRKMLRKLAMALEDSGSSEDSDDGLEDQDDDDEYEQPQEKFDRSRKGKKKDHYLNRQHRDRPDREANWREDNDD